MAAEPARSDRCAVDVAIRRWDAPYGARPSRASPRSWRHSTGLSASGGDSERSPGQPPTPSAQGRVDPAKVAPHRRMAGAAAWTSTIIGARGAEAPPKPRYCRSHRRLAGRGQGPAAAGDRTTQTDHPFCAQPREGGGQTLDRRGQPPRAAWTNRRTAWTTAPRSGSRSRPPEPAQFLHVAMRTTDQPLHLVVWGLTEPRPARTVGGSP